MIDLRTPRQIKAEEIINRILNAMDTLINTHNLSYLTVKNICAIANISNGKFFHFFQSKDDLIIAYMHRGYDNYIKRNPFTIEDGHYIDNIIGLYLHNIDYCKDIGVELVSHYYTINNKDLMSFNPSTDKATPLMMTALAEIEKAKANHFFRAEEDSYEILSDLGMIVKGVILEWTISEGHLNVERKIVKLCRIYLKSLMPED